LVGLLPNQLTDKPTDRWNEMKNKKVWIVLIVIVALVGAGFYFRDDVLGLIDRGPEAAANAQGPGGRPDPEGLTTTTIRPAAESAQVSASGNIEVSNQRPVVLDVDGIVTEVAVEVGDEVDADVLLVALDTADLERAVAQAELSLANAQAQLDRLLELADAAEIASAEASLVSAQENLSEVQAGPSRAELAAAEASVAAAQARYQELLTGPSEAELTQLSAELQKALIDLQQAQWDYDKIAYGDSVGSSPQAAALQQATIDYEAVKAAYEIAVESAPQAELQDALSDIQSAQEQLDTLRNQPTEADLAAAEAQVASAQAQLEELLGDPSQAELRAEEISVEQARPVLSVDVEVGEKVQAGLSAVTLADLNDLVLPVNVAEVDVSKIQPGQGADISIDALPGQTFDGIVTRVAPSSDSESGVVNYPVTIQLADAGLADVRPGMTAVATILDDDASNAGWLVPTNALRERGDNTTVIVLRGGQPTPIVVTTSASQGEWTVVQSPELQAGDEVAGSVSSFLNQDEGPGFGPPRGGPGFGGGFRGSGGSRPQ
jgi:multidrug efflux pump subunit AcrA (membrane-fusion protein)